MRDADYMKLAMDLALRARGKTSPNPMVGAVIVKNNRIVSSGYHKRCGADHAEIAALKRAGKKAKGATLYVTLEPCSHFGRTPPCVDAVIKSGIRKVVTGMIDPNPLNNGQSLRKLRRAGIKTETGLLNNLLRPMNESFMKYIAAKMPFVACKTAQTLDGKIATFSGESKWITSRPARNFAHRLRNDFDAILVGINTVLKDDPYLNATMPSKKIKKIIVDSRLKLPLNAKVFQRTRPSDIIVATTRPVNKSKYDSLAQKGVWVVVCPTKENLVDLAWLFRYLAKNKVTSILIEGGGKIIGSVLKNKLADKFYIFLAPKIMGDKTARNSIEGLSVRKLKKSVTLKDLTVKKIGSDILLEGYVYRHR